MSTAIYRRAGHHRGEPGLLLGHRHPLS